MRCKENTGIVPGPCVAEVRATLWLEQGSKANIPSHRSYGRTRSPLPLDLLPRTGTALTYSCLLCTITGSASASRP